MSGLVVSRRFFYTAGPLVGRVWLLDEGKWRAGITVKRGNVISVDMLHPIDAS